MRSIASELEACFELLEAIEACVVGRKRDFH
jgi:hypothetical protein